ncbi:hypothetical protein JYQ62_04290 [Nostoc sp. UHCC 0702]|nr:hypothetical protein JYQ62_04290 [Nostoc sp. UHCC 0702]
MDEKGIGEAVQQKRFPDSLCNCRHWALVNSHFQELFFCSFRVSPAFFALGFPTPEACLSQLISRLY